MSCAAEVEDSSSSEPGTAQQGLIGGTPTEEPAGAVAVGLSGDEQIARTHCSGALIAPTLVITARHCVDSLTALDPARGIVCGQTRFEEDVAEEPLLVSVASEPDYAPGPTTFRVQQRIRGASDEVCGSDAILLELDRPVPAELAAPIAPRLETNVQLGEPFEAIGYGPAARGSPDSTGVRRRNEAFVDCLAGGCTPSQEPLLGHLEWLSADTGVCPTDSGGPALDADGMLIGVASRGPADCSFTLYGNVHAWRDWLRREVYDISRASGVEVPSWAEAPTPVASEAPVAAEDAGCSFVGQRTRTVSVFGWLYLGAVAFVARRRRRYGDRCVGSD